MEPSPTVASISVLLGPIVEPLPIAVAPCRLVNGAITVSWPIVTSASITVAAGVDDRHPGEHVALVDVALGHAPPPRPAGRDR